MLVSGNIGVRVLIGGPNGPSTENHPRVGAPDPEAQRGGDIEALILSGGAPRDLPGEPQNIEAFPREPASGPFEPQWLAGELSFVPTSP